MALEMCVETYGAAVHIFDAIVGSGILLRGAGQQRDEDRVALSSDASFDDVIRLATNNLAFAEAQALWLVDVCDCTYHEAAGQVGIDRETMALRVDSARRNLRRHVIAPR